MDNLNEKVIEAVEYIRTRVQSDPDIGIVLGSGLGNLAYNIIDPIEISYSDIPYFPTSTVQGHDGKLIFGKIYGKEVVATDLRGGASMLICGLIAEGITIVDNIHFILRGYDNIVEKLTNVGAKIELI